MAEGGPSSSSPDGIDEGLYSRQLYVLGHEAMHQMAKSDILISGLGGLGVEVAKNVILTGVKSVTLHDETLCQVSDLSSQFYLDECDVGKFRAEASLPQLSELNSYVSTQSYTAPLTGDFIKKFRVVVLADVAPGEHLWISEVTHANNIALIIAETRGLFGRIFCDFGKNFTVVDTNGENPVSIMLSSVSKDKNSVVTCLDDTLHGLEDGDYVTFTEVQGMTELNGCKPKQIKVLGPCTFSIGNTSSFSNYVQGGVAIQVKVPKVMSFKRLKDSVKAPEFVLTDFAKSERPTQLHLAFETLHKFVTTRGELPKSWSHKDAAIFLSLAKTCLDGGKDNKIDAELLEIFAKVSRGSLGPFNAIIGGIVAQEVLKACSGKFTPIYQWLYFDAVECLPRESKEIKEEDCKERGHRYDGQTAVFGNTFQKSLGSLKYFVVGAGAIGCELLKNMAMMGVGAMEGGSVTVTDMDTIEKSNLNRQFLFRPADLQKPKSTTAANVVWSMNPAMNMIAHEDRVGPETERFFNDEFFEALDGVANALDNINGRIYMDRRCVYYRKPLLESGTLGTKGNTQVVVPFLTEAYSSSQDSPEKSIPFCTLKNFPNAIEHTLQWARDLFEGLFHRGAENAVQYLNDPGFVDRILKLPGNQPVEVLESVKLALVDQRPNTFEDCVAWARLYWQEQFNNQIQQLLYNFPEDQVTSSGLPFWSGHKRCPVPLSFSSAVPLHVDFIFAAANLKAEVYGIPQNRNRSTVVQILEKVSIPVFSPRSGVNIVANDSQILDLDSPATTNTDHIVQIQKELPSKEQLTNLNIRALEFEKDDDTNLHIDFIVATSNLRAENYKITAADRHKSKLIAGKIIPAIATTTSVVAGLACLELYKLVRGHQTISPFKNGFVNLALPFFGFSEPIAAPKLKYYETEWTLWDRIEVKGEMTLREFIEHFQEKHKLKITILSQGVCMLYSAFLAKDKCEEHMDLLISEVLKKVSKKGIEPHVKELVFEIACDDEDGNDVEVPYIRYSLPT